MTEGAVQVDLGRYVEQVEAQRNVALSEAAKWRAAAEQVMEECDQLRAELAALKE
ncbi:hypothetical protein Ssi03_62790 [Sphaerisporangium siamense]|uniref:Uncharacterized protein n=1 Tax=Sphaerisporangium siamense TaxID=795645 RepID=A0A7W7D989_9ACTN|nr:hypothetical protein [Sphaerisporangium siamense]MBB4702587.1 hypothetical protein [Sphaerisporangium siamense]GII88289.1 hypothetical protein Ssi03_62790 [Sphaerisporangium siamense]